MCCRLACLGCLLPKVPWNTPPVSQHALCVVVCSVTSCCQCTHRVHTSVVVCPVVPSCSLLQHAGATGCPPAKAAGVSHTRAGSQAHNKLLPPSCKHWGPGSSAFECTTAPQPHCRMPTALAAPAAATHSLLAQLQQRAVLCSTKVRLAPPIPNNPHTMMPGRRECTSRCACSTTRQHNTAHTPKTAANSRPQQQQYAPTPAVSRAQAIRRNPRQLQVQGNNMPRPQQSQGRRQHPEAAACRPHKQKASPMHHPASCA
jgi:hypothetical protein